jgi:phage terminase large subunit
MLRKVGKSLKESAEDLRSKILCTTPHRYNKSTGTTTFPNGSKIILGHFRTESDIDSYVGLEYDLIAIEECTTLSGAKYSTIATCCRTSKTGWRPRRYSHANPGGVGHQFYLRKFVNSTDPDVAFIPATYKDNVFLNKDYVKSLENLTGWLRRAWLEGDWNIHAGTYFTTFTKDHVIEPIKRVEHLGWRFHLAADYGWAHPTVFLLFAQDNQNKVYFIDEYSAAKRLPEAHSNMVLEMLSRWGLSRADIRTFILGTDAWKPSEKGVTVADAYRDLGWNPEGANMSRVPGATEFLRRLGDLEAGIQPTVFFFNTCPGLIENLPTMQHDKNRPEDVLKVNVDAEGYGGDDFYDAARYALMAVVGGREVSFGTLMVPR